MTEWKSNVQELKHVDSAKKSWRQGRASTCGALGETVIPT
jgi:hypothetical protein